MKETKQIQYVMTPVPLLVQQESDKEKEDKSKSETSVFGAFFWAIVLLFVLWYITGGYNSLQ
jgi:hypothetical protein